MTGIQRDDRNQIVYESTNTTVLNQSDRQLVVANNLENITIINTEDAVYVGRTGESEKLKGIMKENPEEQHYFDQGRIIYKPWGTYELLNVNPRYVVRKVVVTEGKTIYAHQHAHRTEHWIIVCGRARIILKGSEREYGANDSIEVPENTAHQISNIGNEPLVFMEISTGTMVEERDLISIRSRDLSEAELGYQVEPFVRLLPALKTISGAAPGFVIYTARNVIMKSLPRAGSCLRIRKDRASWLPGGIRGFFSPNIWIGSEKRNGAGNVSRWSVFRFWSSLLMQKKICPSRCIRTIRTPWKRRMSTEK